MRWVLTANFLFVFPSTFLKSIIWISACCYLVLLQIREPFSIMSIVKSPMGLMMGFMLIVVFLMPKLMENMGMPSKVYLWSSLISFQVYLIWWYACLYGCTCSERMKWLLISFGRILWDLSYPIAAISVLKHTSKY